MKVPVNKSLNQLHDGEVISKGHSRAGILPSIGVRFGPVDVFYAEVAYPGAFPVAVPYPHFRVGVGSGFGKTNGTAFTVGYCDGFYTRLVLPVRNTWIVEAGYADNFLTGNEAQRMVTLGLNYRFQLGKNKPAQH